MERADTGVCPYGDLYIYYLEGAVPPAWQETRDPSFLGCWEEEGSSFLFFSGPAREVVESLAETERGLVFKDAYQMAYTDWQGGAAPFTAGPFHVAPPWMPGTPPAGAVQVLLDPGVVFGTGAHPTTRDCLFEIAAHHAEKPLGRVLDLGTGTGLLAVAAGLLGAPEVLAVDLNPLAARTARKNVSLNGLDGRVRVEHGPADIYMGCFADLLAANIHFAVMRGLVASPGFLTKRRFILSGLLRSEVRDIERVLRDLPVQVTGLREWEGTWFTLSGKVMDGGG
jgi:ribosomal protein L11 methyltransferase